MVAGNGGGARHSAGGSVGYRGESLVIAMIQKFITQQVMLRGGGDAASQPAMKPRPAIRGYGQTRRAQPTLTS